MRERYLEVTYRRGQPLVAYLYLPRRDGDRCVRVAREPSGMVVDLAEGDRAIGVEILDPQQVTVKALNATLAKYAQPALDQSELAPLLATA